MVVLRVVKGRRHTLSVAAALFSRYLRVLSVALIVIFLGFTIWVLLV